MTQNSVLYLVFALFKCSFLYYSAPDEYHRQTHLDKNIITWSKYVKYFLNYRAFDLCVCALLMIYKLTDKTLFLDHFLPQITEPKKKLKTKTRAV